jgi:hypothetical protein
VALVRVEILEERIASIFRVAEAIRYSETSVPIRALRCKISEYGIQQGTTNMASSGVLRRVALVRTDGSEELGASFIRVTRISELGTTLADEGGAKFLRNVGYYKSHTA